MSEILFGKFRLPKIEVPRNVFWADHIKTVARDPYARLSLANANLPLPAALREACIALRAIIRDQRKSADDFSYALEQLYRVAALDDFFYGKARMGSHPCEMIAGGINRAAWEHLEMPYDLIGYKHLSLLKITDVKWLREVWGEPRDHQSVQDFHSAAWDKALSLSREKAAKHEKEFDERMRKEYGVDFSEGKPRLTQKTGCLLIVLLAITSFLITISAIT